MWNAVASFLASARNVPGDKTEKQSTGGWMKVTQSRGAHAKQLSVSPIQVERRIIVNSDLPMTMLPRLTVFIFS